MAYALVTKFTTTENAQDEFVDILLQAAQILEKYEDCLYYLISTSKNKNEVYVSEAWSERGAADASLQDEAITTLINKVMPLMAGAPEKLSETEIIGGKGI